jgi:nucleoid-associated protein YgaU
MKKTSALTASLVLALAVTGCAHKDEIKPEPTPAAQDTPTPTPEPTLVPHAEAPVKESPESHYKVRKGDSLWKIAAKTSVLGDAFQWPLLYKQNRDAIADPDLIEISQVLDYSSQVDAADAAAAIQKAKETPPYVPHSTPRNPLPLKY